MTDEHSPSEELLAIYHDLWDLKLRADRQGRGFLVYLLQLALEDVHQDLPQTDAAANQLAHGPGR